MSATFAAPAPASPSLRPPRHVPLAVVTRGNAPEYVHYGSVVVVDARGTHVASVGDARGINFTRSSLKPLQALPFIEDDGPARFGFDSQAVALMCASHGGEAIHIATAQKMLDAIDASEADLQCGCHVPNYFSHVGQTAPAGVRWNQLFHNCSGKHAGFLAYCRLHGKPLKSYLDPDSPLQARVRATVQRFAGNRALPMGIDGCSAPNYALPLDAIAHTFCRLALGETPALDALRFAMTRHPDLVSGTAAGDLALMQAGRGDWVAKIGAQDLQAVGIRSKGIGIAVRIADGDRQALMATTVEVLQQLQLIDDVSGTPLAQYARPRIKNHRGIVTGELVPVFNLPRVFL